MAMRDTNVKNEKHFYSVTLGYCSVCIGVVMFICPYVINQCSVEMTKCMMT